MAEEEEEETSGGVGPGTVALFGAIFLPAGIVATVFYLLLRKARLPLITLFQIFVVFEVLIGLLWVGSSSTSRFTSYFSSLMGDGPPWTSLIWPLVLFYAAVGGIMGLFIAWWEVRQMKANPHRLELKGNWQYKFEFRRNLRQTFSRNKRVQALKQGVLVDEEKAPIGINEIDDRPVFRYYTEASTHTLISGATGSGKTLSMQSLFRADMENHVPSFIIDFKRSPEMAAKIASWAKENDCKFYHFVNGDLSDYDIKHSEGPVRYDPLASGSPTAKADLVLGMREYDTASAVYKANMQQLLQVVFAMLHYAEGKKDKIAGNIKWEEGGIYLLASAISGDNLTELAVACEGTPIYKDAQLVAEQSKTRGTGLRHALEELQGQLRTILASEYGQWMRTSPHDRGVDLFELSQQPGTVVLFSLNSDSEPEFARYVGSMILADITNTSARRRNRQLKNPVHVYVDEFQAVTPSAVTGLLEKSRESRMAVTLAQQSFEQVVKAAPQNGEAYLLSILDTCSNFLIHNGMTEDSAERLSKILGKHEVTKYRSTNKNQSFFLSMNWKNKRDSVVTTAQEEEWVVPPRFFMSLMSPVKANGFKSTAVLINKACSDPSYAGKAGAVARKVWLIPALEVLETYYELDYRLHADEASSTDVVLEGGSSVPLLPGDELDLDSYEARPEVVPTLSFEDLEHDHTAANDREIAAALARRRQGRNAQTFVEEDAEDGAFVFEELDEAEVEAAEDPDLAAAAQKLKPKSPRAPEDVDSLFGPNAGPPPRRDPAPPPAKKSSNLSGLPRPVTPSPEQRKPGLPLPPRKTGGLPLPVPDRDESKEDGGEETALPQP